MEYRRYVAKTLEEAKSQMRRELGDQAYIIQRKDIVRKKYFGLVKEHFVELSAARSSDMELPGGRKNISQKQAAYESAKPVRLERTPQRFVQPSANSQSAPDHQKLKNLVDMIGQKYSGRPARTEGLIKTSAQSWLEQLEESEETQIYESAPSRPAIERAQPVMRTAPARPDILPQAAPVVRSIQKPDSYKFLQDMDFSQEFSEEAAQSASNADPSTMEGRGELAAAVAAMLSYSGEIKLYAGTPNLVFLVGPTGVGKTTTMAKIASEYSITKRQQVMLATFDVRRIAATAQLEKYANIMEVPFQVLDFAKDLKNLLQENIKRNLICIDTAGTSQNDLTHIEETADFTNFLDTPREVHLCLNASQRIKDLRHVAERFAPVRYDRILITKSDESSSLGAAISCAWEVQAPLSYITDGQDVPGCLMCASRQKLSEKLLEQWQ